MVDEKRNLLEKLGKALLAMDEFIEACQYLGVGLDFDDLIDDASKLSPVQLNYLLEALDKAGVSLEESSRE